MHFSCSFGSQCSEAGIPADAGMRTNLETAAYATKIASITILVVSIATTFFALLTSPAGAALLITLFQAPLIAFSVDGILASRAAMAIVDDLTPLDEQLRLRGDHDAEQVWQKLIEKCLDVTFFTQFFLQEMSFCASQQVARESWERKLQTGLDNSHIPAREGDFY